MNEDKLGISRNEAEDDPSPAGATGPAGRERTPFSQEQLGVVRTAVSIAEELTAEHFKLSLSDWKKIRYDIKTLAALNEDEITNNAFAQIFKYSREPRTPPQPSRVLDYYLICLQDHNILRALHREPQITLLGLCLYVLTHELVHVVRFSRFFKRYECSEEERQEEEAVVHGITYEILRKLKWPELGYLLQSYTGFRDTDRIVR